MTENKKFVVKSIWNEDHSVFKTDYFDSREKAEELKELYDFGIECLNGKGQTDVTVVIEEV